MSVTSQATPPATIPAPPPPPPPPTKAPRWVEPLLLTSLLTCTAVLYLWDLSISGWGNTYYAAAAQAGADNWQAFLYGASDPQAFITVDKPPAAIWLMALSVKLFGLSSWSVLLPQAILGIASVAIVYATVRRVRNMWVALIAGAVFATTPIATLIFRYNNPDALLVFLITLAGYCCVRFLQRGALAWAAGIGVALGFAFLTKQLQGLLIAPGLAVAMLVSGAITLRRRFVALGVVAAGALVSAGWWVAIVTLTPPGDRPYIGGSPTNSFLELTFGYNGFQRLTGSKGSGLQSVWEGLGRLTSGAIGWLLPAAIILGTAAVIVMLLARHHRDPRFGLLLFGLLSIVVNGAALTMMSGIYHSYYTVVMAPAIAVVCALGAAELWRYRALPWSRAILTSASAISSVLALFLLITHDLLLLLGFIPLAAAAGLSLAVQPTTNKQVRGMALIAIIAALIGPLVYSMDTVRQPHSGSGPMAGPYPGRSAPQHISPRLEDLLRTSAGQSDWVAAMIGSRPAAVLQLESGQGILPIGGYKKKDPAPTLDEFAQMVADHRIRWFIDGSAGSGEAKQIRDWVRAAFPYTIVGGARVYDLFQTPKIASSDPIPFVT